MNKTKTPQRRNVVTALVTRGFAINQQPLVLNEEFKKIKERLKAEAVSRPNEHLPLLEKDSEGAQRLAIAKGCECRIVFPDPKVTSEFDPGTSNFLAIRSLAGDHFRTLLKRSVLFLPVDKKTFRTQIKVLLSAKAAAELLELTTTTGETKAIWKSRPTGKGRK